MGLDWIVGAKPAPGHERDGWAALLRGIESGDAAAWQAIPTVDSWTALGAPVVGQDPEADRWMLARMRGVDGPIDLASATPEERAQLRESAGYHVLALAPDCDGLPVYSNSPVNSELEDSSFRAAFLHELEGHIDPALIQRAYTRQLPDAFAEYARALTAASDAFNRQHGVAEIAATYAPPDADEGSPPALAHILASAARWATYWSERGFWLDVWF